MEALKWQMPTLNMLAVEITDLRKEYRVDFWRKRPVRGLNGINLEVQTREIFGLLGPNGAGKTTTLKILLRLIFPTSGTAKILDQPIEQVAVHQRLGYLPENPYFYDHLSAREFLHYVGELFGLKNPQRARRVEMLIERVGLAEHPDLELRKFSKGMVQRVGLAQALINDPELVILDEPMSGLDPLGRREFREIILQLKAQGKTVIFSTHILSDAETLCDRVAILDRGELRGCGDLRGILGVQTSATELVLEAVSPLLLETLASSPWSVVKTGAQVCVEVVGEEEVEKVLDHARRHGAHLLSLNPIRSSLEEFFMRKVAGSVQREEEKKNHPPQEGVEKNR